MTQDNKLGVVKAVNFNNNETKNSQGLQAKRGIKLQRQESWHQVSLKQQTMEQHFQKTRQESVT